MSRPVPERDASTREMFAKLRNQEFSVDSVHQAFTKALASKVGWIKIDPAQFQEKFAAWKSLGPAGENNDYNFGKDGFYASPLVNGKMILKHVHLVPDGNPKALAQWNRDWDKYRRRSSDNALIYAEDKLYGYLLITTLWSPDAHEIPKMKTQQHREIMNSFAQVAEHFIHTGEALV
jgi:hypothetical protein